MTRHLGDRITAFIDGELDHGTRDRILGHLAQCSDCRTEADVERQVKARLTGLGEPLVPVELMLGLLSLDTTRDGAVTGGGPNFPGSGSAGALFTFQTVPIRPPAAPVTGRPATGRGPVRPQRLRVAAIGAFSLAAIGTGAWLIGDLGSSGAPTTHPPVVPAGVVGVPAGVGVGPASAGR